MSSKDFEINQWSNWLKELALSVEDFYNTFDKLPNILEANEHTFSQFEFMTEVSPIGQEIKNVDTNKIGNETKKPRIRELTIKDCYVISENQRIDKKRLDIDTALTETIGADQRL
jgi:ribosomal protein L11